MYCSFSWSDSGWISQVRIVLEGVDKFSNLIGSVYYSDGETAKDLALELVENVSQLNFFFFGILTVHICMIVTGYSRGDI